ncbi:MBL fold metallo-hydrolase [Burkholderia sp. BCC1998]|uniref:MBL fold metallo-hydrolase n=1 Tax=Burkholderia sp. BCC1998 TaxID=2817447 RepID=UPI002AB63278|nr:MBL fold metallo-hydrolase [Burkholderia sp. BCC1998]
MSTNKRRDVLKMGLAGLGSALLPTVVPTLAAAQDSVAAAPKTTGTRLILLGTKGGPRVGLGRSNPANLLVINDVPYVIDCGMGVSRQFVKTGIPLSRLRYVFITHHHSDHNLEYGNLLYNAWATGLKARIDAYGPSGLERMTRNYWDLNRFDIETRIDDEQKPDLRKLVVAHDVTKDGVVLENADVRVTALRTPHPPIADAFAYRFETRDRVVVFSGDTAYNPKLANFAHGADVLVHEVLYPPGVDALAARIGNAATAKKHLIDSHTSTDELGRLAAEAQVKMLVLSHLVPGDDEKITDELWTRDIRKHYKGPIVVGRDMMEI